MVYRIPNNQQIVKVTPSVINKEDAIHFSYDKEKEFMPYQDHFLRLPLDVPNILSLCETKDKTPWKATDEIVKDSIQIQGLHVVVFKSGECRNYFFVSDNFTKYGFVEVIKNIKLRLNSQTNRLTSIGGINITEELKALIGGGDFAISGVGVKISFDVIIDVLEKNEPVKNLKIFPVCIECHQEMFLESFKYHVGDDDWKINRTPYITGYLNLPVFVPNLLGLCTVPDQKEWDATVEINPKSISIDSVLLRWRIGNSIVKTPVPKKVIEIFAVDKNLLIDFKRQTAALSITGDLNITTDLIDYLVHAYHILIPEGSEISLINAGILVSCEVVDYNLGV